MKKRNLLAIVCICILSLTMQISAVAASIPGTITPKWTNTSTINLVMSYSGGKVNWQGDIQGKSTTVKIVATYTMEKKNANGTYTYVNSWSNLSTTKTYLSSLGSQTAVKGTYKLTVTGTVTSSTGYAEPVSGSLEKTFT